MTMDNKESKNIYEVYRKELLERQRLNSSAFDKAILTLSAAGLGISISFITNLVPIADANNVILLQTSWGLFGLAIVVTVFSFITSQFGIDCELLHAKEYYLDLEDESINKTNRWAKATSWLGYASALLFTVAMTLIVCFAILNIKC